MPLFARARPIHVRIEERIEDGMHNDKNHVIDTILMSKHALTKHMHLLQQRFPNWCRIEVEEVHE